MPIDYVCPFCHAKFFVDDIYRGKSGPCAECGKTITIPGKATTSTADQQIEQRVAAMEVRTRRALAIRIGISVFAVLVLTTLAYLLTIVVVPEVRKLATRRDNARSYTNLRLVAKALNEYAAEFGTYPPPVVTDSAGLPLYSWRVLILPQLGYTNLYNQFQLDQAWDSPENLQLTNMIPEPYRIGNGAGVLFNGETSVSLVVGPGTLFPAAGPLGPNVVTDDPSTTLLVTEAARVINTWTSPGDCSFAAATKVGSAAGVDIGNSRPEFAIAISVDERMLAIPNSVSGSSLRSLITPQGNEPINANDFKPSQFGIYDQ